MAKTVDKLKEIIRLDSELNKVQDLDILLERILLEARRVTNAEAGSIYVRGGDKLSIKYSQNLMSVTTISYSSYSHQLMMQNSQMAYRFQALTVQGWHLLNSEASWFRH